MSRLFRILRKLILVSLTCAALLFAALWLTATFMQFLGRNTQGLSTLGFKISNLPSGGWVITNGQKLPIRLTLYATRENVCVYRYAINLTSVPSKYYKFVYGGFGFWHATRDEGPYTTIALPHWFLVAAFGAYPSLVLTRNIFRRWKVRRNPNNCTNCGYNLTGNVSGTCPECGTNIKRATNREPETLA